MPTQEEIDKMIRSRAPKTATMLALEQQLEQAQRKMDRERLKLFIQDMLFRSEKWYPAGWDRATFVAYLQKLYPEIAGEIQ